MKKEVTVLVFHTSFRSSWNEMQDGVYRYARAHGWNIFVAEHEMDREAVADLLAFWRPDGVIVEGAMDEKGVFLSGVFGDLPVAYVVCDRRHLPPDALSVSHDLRAFGRVAAREFLSMRLTSFAFFGFAGLFWSARGAHATEGVDANGLGCGANAVRVLGINADNVVISNLTLTGGATHDSSDGNDRPENNGGGVYVANGRTGIVIVDCIIDRNEGYATTYYPELASCTFGADNTQNGQQDGTAVIVDSGDIRNCLFLGASRALGKTDEAGEVIRTRFYDCVFSPKTKDNLDRQATAQDGNRVFVDASCTAATELAVTEGYTPVIGANAAIDAANAESYDAALWGETDVYGNPRRVNGRRLDVGAVEADWKETYTKRIGRRFTVTAADPEVELVEDGVSLPAGASLTATVGRADRANGAYVLKATVNGATCAVTQDGSAVAALAKGANAVCYRTGAGGLLELVLTADAFGSTVVSSLTSESGLSFILR